MWKPGQSGNPAGRPKIAPMTAALREAGAANDGERWKKAAEVLWSMALDDRDLAALKTIFERLEGKPAQAIALQVEGSSLPELLARMAANATNTGGGQ